MPKKKKHPARTPKFTRSKSRETQMNSFSTPQSPQITSTYPDSVYFMNKDMSQPTNISSSTPILGTSDSMITESSCSDLSLADGVNTCRNESMLCSGINSACNVDEPKGNIEKEHEQYDSDPDYDQEIETENETGIENSSDGTPVDNDSLLKSLQIQSASNMLPLKSMFRDLLDGFNHQLRLEIKSDMKTLLESNKSEMSEFKSQINTKISKIDSKIDSTIVDVNQKIDTLLKKVEKTEHEMKPISDEKLSKIDEVIASNISLTDKINDHINFTTRELNERKIKEEDLTKSIDFLSKEIQDLREENKTLKQKNANLEVKIDNQGTYNRRLKTQFNTLCVEKTASEVRQRKLNLVFEKLKEKLKEKLIASTST